MWFMTDLSETWNFIKFLYYKDIKVKFEDGGKVHRKHNKHSFNQPRVNRDMFTNIDEA